MSEPRFKRDRLVPALLDRLMGDPRNPRAERGQDDISLEQLRECVRRDLEDLLNTVNLASVLGATLEEGEGHPLEHYPEVARSVLNFGMPALAGTTGSNVDTVAFERAVRQVIFDFEPRLLRRSLSVKALVNDDEMSRNALTIEIDGELWAQPRPRPLHLRYRFDFEDGSARSPDGEPREGR
jgi:type VI secretion system protein ImpF